LRIGDWGLVLGGWCLGTTSRHSPIRQPPVTDHQSRTACTPRMTNDGDWTIL
jgi:hypothetical protein